MTNRLRATNMTAFLREDLLPDKYKASIAESVNAYSGWICADKEARQRYVSSNDRQPLDTAIICIPEMKESL